MKALVLHQRQVHVLHRETNTHVQFVTALNTLYLKKKTSKNSDMETKLWDKVGNNYNDHLHIQVHDIQVFKLKNRHEQVLVPCCIKKKSTYIVSVHIQVHTCISRIPYLVHLVVDTLCLVEHGMAGPSTQGQGSLGVQCPPQLL